MEPRPLIALILQQVIYALFQLLANNSNARPGLVAAWTIIVFVVLIEMRTNLVRIAQAVVQTAWFILLLSGFQLGRIPI